MNRQTILLSALSLCIVLSFACPRNCFARLKEVWSYQGLLDESDLVVIAVATSVKAADQGTDITPLNRKQKDILKVLKNNPSDLLDLFKGDDWPYEGIVTTFRVGVTLRGTLDDQEIEIVHCRDKHGSEFTMNGYGFVCFEIEEGAERKLGPHWDFPDFGNPAHLLFLKKRKDGRYEMVRGQMDAVDAVFEITSPSSHTTASLRDGVSDIHFPPPKTFAMSLPVKLAFLVMAVALTLVGVSSCQLRRKLQEVTAQNQIGSDHEKATA